jgi:hypothetical protein
MTTVFMESTRNLFQKISSSLTRNTNLKVIFSKNRRTSTDFQNIYINIPEIENFKELDEVEKYLMGLFLNYHEIAHNLYTNFETLELLNKSYDSNVRKNIAHKILNILEDARIEEALVADYQGLIKIRDFTNKFYHDKGLESKKEREDKASPLEEFFSSLWIYAFFDYVPGIENKKINKIFKDKRIIKEVDGAKYKKTSNELLPIVNILMSEIENLIQELEEDYEKQKEMMEALQELMEALNMDQELEEFENNNEERVPRQSNAVPQEKEETESEDEPDEESGASNSKDDSNEFEEDSSKNKNGSSTQEDLKEDSNEEKSSSKNHSSNKEENDKEDNDSNSSEENNSNKDTDEEKNNSSEKEEDKKEKKANKEETEKKDTENTSNDDKSDNNEEDTEKKKEENSSKNSNPLMSDKEYKEFLEEKKKELEELKQEEKEREKAKKEEDKKSKANHYGEESELEGIHEGVKLFDIPPITPSSVSISDKNRYKNIVNDVNPVIKDFTNSIKRIMIYRKNNSKVRNKKTGKLDNRNLYKIKSGKTDMFYKKRKDLPNMSFMLLLDASGSMSCGRRATNALKAGIMFHEGLQKLDIVHALWSFRTVCGGRYDYTSIGGVLNYRHINFEQSLISRYNYGVSNYQVDGENRDGYSIRIATKALEERREERKIMFVISDGQPSHSYKQSNATHYSDSTALEDTKKAIIEAERKGITLAGISIGNNHNHIDYLYKNKIKVNRIEHLNKKVETLLKRFILS